MLLAIDIGNTNLHLGLWQDDEWKLKWRARTVANKMGDEYAVLIRNFLEEIDLDFHDVKRVVIASVVPGLTAAFRALVQRYFDVSALIVDHTTPMGITIDIDFPEQVGADRIVNAAAVQALYGGGPAIVVDFGTSTNFDVLSRNGAYIGGAISIGMNVAMEALVSKAARLYTVDLLPPPNPIGRNTSHAMQSGLFLGYVSLVEGLTMRLKSGLPEADQTNVKVIATGGLAPLIDEQTHVIDQIVDALTIDGLRVIWNINHPDDPV